MNKPYLWQDDPALKNLFDAEMGLLRRGLNGCFALDKILDPANNNGKIIAVGVLKFNGSMEQSVLISFPPKYPFSPPSIIAINTPSKNENGEIIESFQKHLFGTKQQYGDGKLCLHRRELWDINSPQGIGWSLRRAQDWLISFHSKSGFSEDQIVEEYPTMFPHQGQVLMPRELCFPKSAKSGEIVLRQFKPNHYMLVDNMVTNSPFDMELNQEVFTWFRFNEASAQDVLKSIKGDQIAGLLKNRFGVSISFDNSQYNLAFHFPNDTQQWYFFKIIVINTGISVQLKTLYYIARVVENELYLRTSSIFSDKILSKKRVTIIGLGAIGSEVAKSLARNAVGHFNFFDSDTFEIGNSVRHAADLYYIGERKINVAKSLVQRSNPNITVNAYDVDVLDDVGMLEESLMDSDLCIVLTGEESVDYFINDKFIKEFRIPYVFARASAGGVSGSIQIVKYDETPCLRCLSSQGLDYLPKSNTNNSYSELKPEYGSCSSPALPGSEVDTKEIALQVSRVTLQLLLKKELTNYPKVLGMQYYWHGPYGSQDHSPFTWQIENHGKDGECKICKQ